MAAYQQKIKPANPMDKPERSVRLMHSSRGGRAGPDPALTPAPALDFPLALTVLGTHLHPISRPGPEREPIRARAATRADPTRTPPRAVQASSSRCAAAARTSRSSTSPSTPRRSSWASGGRGRWVEDAVCPEGRRRPTRRDCAWEGASASWSCCADRRR